MMVKRFSFGLMLFIDVSDMRASVRERIKTRLRNSVMETASEKEESDIHSEKRKESRPNRFFDVLYIC